MKKNEKKSHLASCRESDSLRERGGVSSEARTLERGKNLQRTAKKTPSALSSKVTMVSVTSSDDAGAARTVS